MTRSLRVALILTLSIVGCAQPPAADQAAADAYTRAQTEIDRYSERAGRDVAALQALPAGSDDQARTRLIVDLRTETIRTIVARDSVIAYLTIEQMRSLSTRERQQFGAAVAKALSAAGKEPDIDQTYRMLVGISPLLNPLAQQTSSAATEPLSQANLVAPPPPQGLPQHSPIPPVDQEQPSPRSRPDPDDWAFARLPPSTFTNAPYYTGGQAGPDHDEVQCGILGPSHAEATCDSATSQAACGCYPNLGLWGIARCGCQPGRRAGSPELASPDKQCVLEPQEVYCGTLGNVRRYPAFPWASNCFKGWHGWCEPTVCYGNEFRLGNVGCTPDGR